MMKNIIQAKLNEVLAKVSNVEAEYTLESYKKLKSALSSKVVSEKLKISEAMLFEFEEALKQYFQYRDDKVKSRISCFRFSLWLETICKNLGSSFSLDESISNEELAIKQVRALELIIRDVVNENLGGKENVFLKLKELFKQDIVEKWLKNADDTGVLSGTTFSELSAIFLDKNIFKSIEEIVDTSQLNLSKTSRDSLRYILEDIRLIRNSIAHNKKISSIQIEALNEYYRAIANLIKESKSNRINPDSYLDLDKIKMEEFISGLKEDNEMIYGNIESIKKTVETINVNIDKGFSEINEKNEKIHKELKSKWVSKKFLVLYTIILTLSVVLIVAYNSFSNRKITTKIQLNWLSEKASYKFQELDKISIQTDNFKGDYFINSSGIIDLTDLPSENLDNPIILSFQNTKLYQIDTPLIVRDVIIPIRISLKNLDQVNFIIRDSNTGEPINEASIQFSGIKLTTDSFGKASAKIPPNKISKFIDIEVVGKGYKYYKLNDVLVNSQIPIEILLEK
jgi:hypothetical protein